jgi:NADPH:quinone reductase
MRAIQFEAFGNPSVLEVVEVVTPTADEKRVLVRVMAASINPSDVKKVAGVMKQTTLPRTPGRDFVDDSCHRGEVDHRRGGPAG